MPDTNSRSSRFEDPIQQEEHRQVAEAAPQALRWAKQYGIKIFWGTDVLFGDVAFQSFRHEFASRDDTFTPIEQGQQVTGINGKILALSTWKNPYPHGALGVIREGSCANLLRIDGDPAQDIRLLMDSDNIDLIMTDGGICKDTL